MPVKKKLVAATSKVSPTSRGEVTRSKVIEVAHDLFLKHGFHGASMRQIADAAGVAVGGIYNHFGNKEEIFVAVLDAYHPYREILPALEATKGETVDIFVRDGAQRVWAAIAGSAPQLLPLVFVELVEFQGRHFGQLAERLLPSLLTFTQRFSQRRGRLRPLPLPVILRAFVGLLMSSILIEIVAKHIPLMKDVDYDWFGGMVDIYLHGIIEPEA